MPKIVMEFRGEHTLTEHDVRDFNKSRVWYRSDGIRGEFPRLSVTYQAKEDGAAAVRWVLEATTKNPGLEVILSESSPGVLWGFARTAKHGTLAVVEQPPPVFRTKLEAELYEQRLERAMAGEWENAPERFASSYLQIDGRAVHGLQIRFPEQSLEQVLVNVTNQYISRMILEDESWKPSIRYQGNDFVTTVRFPLEVAKRIRRAVDQQSVSPSDLVNQAISDLAETTNW